MVLKRICSKIYNPKLRTNNNTQNKIPYYVSKKIKEAITHEDVRLYIKLVTSGEFYEYYGNLLKNDGILNTHSKQLRKEAKDSVFSSIFSPNTAIGYNKSIQLFKKIFPNVYDIFSNIKIGKGNHPTLACTLQNIEATIVLDIACREIEKINSKIPIFTLHDSIITTKKHIEFIEKILFKSLHDFIGIPPSLKREFWVA